jgi:16S rRNA (guanine(966)-N(2))-methyltransferase RsmD
MARPNSALSQAAALRPTPDRVRETLFNWLGQELTGRRCLELYAGTGVLSLEAASRGAALAVAVERDRMLVDALCATAALLGAAPSRRIVRMREPLWAASAATSM